MKRSKENYDNMTAAELREATRVFDRELPVGRDGLPGRPLTASEQKQWKQVQNKMGVASKKRKLRP